MIRTELPFLDRQRLLEQISLPGGVTKFPIRVAEIYHSDSDSAVIRAELPLFYR